MHKAQATADRWISSGSSAVRSTGLCSRNCRQPRNLSLWAGPKPIPGVIERAEAQSQVAGPKPSTMRQHQFRCKQHCETERHRTHSLRGTVLALGGGKGSHARKLGEVVEAIAISKRTARWDRIGTEGRNLPTTNSIAALTGTISATSVEGKHLIYRAIEPND